MIIAFGLGLSVLVTVSLSEANLGRQIDTRLANDAPDWFFIDIQPHQMADFEQTVANIDGITEMNKTPMLRGRVVKLAGVPVSQITPTEGSAWILRGDRALTWSAKHPKGSELVEGEWWDSPRGADTRLSQIARRVVFVISTSPARRPSRDDRAIALTEILMTTPHHHSPTTRNGQKTWALALQPPLPLAMVFDPCLR